jgi:ABC-type glycerol-3-phosphate transport system substrate-binding protein
MKKKILSALLILTVAFSLSACGSSSTSNSDTSVESQVNSEEITSESQTSENNETSNPMVSYESPLGYTVDYNSDMFTLTSTDASDTFTYSGDQLEPEAPIYVAIQLLTDMDAKSAANGLALQSGQDDVVANESSFGDDNEGYIVSYSEEAEGIMRNYMFFVVPKNEGCLIMEVGNYDGYDNVEIDGNIELIVDSFKPVE